ncbi:TM2 domain-containing protein [Sphingomonas sp. MG17]|jgi:TM2 domain-containing membrane protein YozV|uniref:TM2 domain-containing protein n=1 Tax=Sphingomonas tagetis TaxID=2949092 RepID=A0A9X2HPE4_9SPHN|nr:TM2 domain-containing protein [Sphingomonas tagetis]MCP3730100.1 TM2 domain-containing protein [Sphingomonas tagetis]
MDATERSELVRSQLMYDASRKSAGIAYVLWFFLGWLGGHRFYLGRTGTAVAQLLLSIVGWLTLVFIVGIFMLAGVGIWLLVDAFLIPGMIREHNMKLASDLTGGPVRLEV